MFIFGYFVIVGAVLLGIIMWAAEAIAPMCPVIATSQEVGLKEAFRGHTEVAQPRIKDEPERAAPAASSAKDDKQAAVAEAKKPPREKHVRRPRPIDRETDGRGDRYFSMSPSGTGGGEAYGVFNPH